MRSRGLGIGCRATLTYDAVVKLDGIGACGAPWGALRIALNASSRQGPQPAVPAVAIVTSVAPTKGTSQAQSPNSGLALPSVEKQMEPLTIGGNTRNNWSSAHARSRQFESLMSQ